MYMVHVVTNIYLSYTTIWSGEKNNGFWDHNTASRSWLYHHLFRSDLWNAYYYKSGTFPAIKITMMSIKALSGGGDIH